MPGCVWVCLQEEARTSPCNAGAGSEGVMCVLREGMFTGWVVWPTCSCTRLIVVAALAPFQLQLQGIPAVMWPRAGTGGISLDPACASAVVEPGRAALGTAGNKVKPY